MESFRETAFQNQVHKEAVRRLLEKCSAQFAEIKKEVKKERTISMEEFVRQVKNPHPSEECFSPNIEIGENGTMFVCRTGVVFVVTKEDLRNDE